jgi:hypothetical protein
MHWSDIAGEAGIIVATLAWFGMVRTAWRIAGER